MSDERAERSSSLGLSEAATKSLLEVLGRSQQFGFLGDGPLSRQIEHSFGFAESIDVPDRALDLGSGGGVPGLVLALLWSNTNWTLLDSVRRRTEFLAVAVKGLGVEDRVEVVMSRAEDLARRESYRGSFDLVTARSFGPPAVAAECAAGFLRLGGRLVVSEPPLPNDRWSRDGLLSFGLEKVSRSGAPYAVLVKTAELDPRFPRRSGVPAKRPLW